MTNIKGKVTLKIFFPGFIGFLLVYFLMDYALRVTGVYEGIINNSGFFEGAERINQMKVFGSFLIFPFFYIGAWWGAKRVRNEFGNLITTEVVKHVKFYIGFLSFFTTLFFVPEMIGGAILYSVVLTNFLVKKWLPVTAVENTVVSPINGSGQ